MITFSNSYTEKGLTLFFSSYSSGSADESNNGDIKAIANRSEIAAKYGCFSNGTNDWNWTEDL